MKRDIKKSKTLVSLLSIIIVGLFIGTSVSSVVSERISDFDAKKVTVDRDSKEISTTQIDDKQEKGPITVKAETKEQEKEVSTTQIDDKQEKGPITVKAETKEECKYCEHLAANENSEEKVEETTLEDIANEYGLSEKQESYVYQVSEMVPELAEERSKMNVEERKALERYILNTLDSNDIDIEEIMQSPENMPLQRRIGFGRDEEGNRFIVGVKLINPCLMQAIEVGANIVQNTAEFIFKNPAVLALAIGILIAMSPGMSITTGAIIAAAGVILGILDWLCGGLSDPLLGCIEWGDFGVIINNV